MPRHNLVISSTAIRLVFSSGVKMHQRFEQFGKTGFRRIVRCRQSDGRGQNIRSPAASSLSARPLSPSRHRSKSHYLSAPAQFLRQLLYDAERRVEEHNIGINHRFGGGVMHAVDKTKVKRLVACRSRARIARNMRRQFVFLQRMAERRPIRPRPIRAILGWLTWRPHFDLFQCGQSSAIGGLRADAQTQHMRQAIGGQRAWNDSIGA